MIIISVFHHKFYYQCVTKLFYRCIRGVLLKKYMEPMMGGGGGGVFRIIIRKNHVLHFSITCDCVSFLHLCSKYCTQWCTNCIDDLLFINLGVHVSSHKVVLFTFI